MKKYNPILKSRQGELQAIAVFDSTIANLFEPIIEILPNSIDKAVKELLKTWTFEGNSILLDISYIKEKYQEVIEAIYLLKDAGVNAIPVVELSSQDGYLKDAINYSFAKETKICIRIKGGFLNPRIFIPLLKNLLKEFKLLPSQVILLIDYEYVSSQSVITTSFYNFLPALGDLSAWSKVIFAGGSFPKDLGQIQPNTKTFLPRLEWKAFQEIISHPSHKNLINFGDYGIKHPIYYPTTEKFSATSSVKYTTDSDFAIYRGILPKKHELGMGQYHLKCRELIVDSHYDGKHFSWADNQINECASRSKNPGNAGTWVKIGHSRHIAKMVSLL